MPRRPVFAADTPATALRDYVINAVAELFHRPRVLPILRRPPAEPPGPLPMLFEDLPEQRQGEPTPVPPAPEPEPAIELDERDFPNFRLMSRIVGDAIAPPSQLTITRRRKARERAEAAAAATAREAAVAAVEPEPVPEPAAPFLTMDMGRFRDAHGIDRCEVGPNGGYVVACPPFHLHDEEHVEPVDEFLGQVVAFVTDTRALVFRRRDPDVMDGCEVGQRYVLMRFHDDEHGQVWSMPVEGEDEAAVLTAIRAATALYRRSWRDP